MEISDSRSVSSTGLDNLINIETLRFSDREIDFIYEGVEITGNEESETIRGTGSADTLVKLGQDGNEIAGWTITNDRLSGGQMIIRSDGTIESSGFASDVACLLYTSPSPRDLSTSRMPSSA